MNFLQRIAPKPSPGAGGEPICGPDNMTSRTLAAALLVLLPVACQRPAAAPPSPQVYVSPSQHPSALITNGGFEDGTLNGWSLPIPTNLNHTIIYPPSSTASLQLQPGGLVKTFVRGGPNGTLVPSGLASSATLRFPRFGTATAVVNELGANYNVNTLEQTYTTTAADVDPADGNIHIRFAIAPVLQNGGSNHTSTQQPYYWVEVRNVTQGTSLFQRFHYALEPGVPWQGDAVPVTSSTVVYTDWQAFDVAPGNVALSVGDQVQVKIIAAGCSQSGHWGEVYVDAFGSFLPGVSAAATAVASVNQGSDITYTYRVTNTGPGDATSVALTQPVPANTTFKSVDTPGASCTAPAAGASTGDIVCTLGGLPVSAATSLQITFKVNDAATGTVSNGNYTVAADAGAPLIGPLAQTNITQNVRYADLGISMSDGVAGLAWGDALTYVINVTNSGPADVAGATVTDAIPAQLTGATWTCAAQGGACAQASGIGDIATTVDLISGGQATFAISASVIAGSGNGSVRNVAYVAVPSGFADPITSNNAAAVTNGIGSLVTLEVDKPGVGQGTVTSSPAAISCGPGCTTQSASFLDGSLVSLTASAASGHTFTGWGGACSGTASVCNVTLAGATTVTATFTGPPSWSITTSRSGSGTLSCPALVNDQTSATCYVTPGSGWSLTSLTDNGADVTAQVASGQYALAVVIQAHALVATFAPPGFALSTSATGAGTVSCPALGQSGQPATCTVAPAAGWVLGTLTDNGADVTAQVSGGSYVIASVTTAHALVAKFLEVPSVSVASSANPASHGQLVTLTATVSGLGPTPGGTVSFSAGGVALPGCTSLSLSSSSATCATAALPVSAGISIAAAFSGDGSYAAETATLSQEVDKATPQISWAAPPPLAYATPLGVQLNASANTAGTFVYAPAAGTVLDVGPSQPLLVTFTPADFANYLGVSASVAIDVVQRTQTVAFHTLAPVVYGAPDFDPGANASTGLQVTYASDSHSVATVTAGGLVHIVGAGTAVLTATQAGDGRSLPASAQQSLTVSPAPLSVRAGDASRAAGSANPTFAAIYSGFVLGETASVLTGAPAFSTSADPASAVGSYAITASAGTLAAANYAFTFVAGTLSVGLQSQPISFSLPATFTYGDAPFVLTATGGTSGNQLVFTSSDPGVAGVTGSTVTIAGAGQVTISASQAGDATHGSGSAQVAITVLPAPLQVIAQDESRPFGAAAPAFTAAYTGFVAGDTAAVLTGAPAFSTTTDASSPVGSYSITVSAGTLSAANYRFVFVSGTLGVGLASQSLVFAAPAAHVYGDAPFLLSAAPGASGTGVSFTSGNPAVATVAGSTVTIVGAGEAVLVATQPSDGAYASATAAQTLRIARAPLTVTVFGEQRFYGQPDPAFTARYSLFAYGELPTVLGGAASIFTATDATTPVGAYPIRVEAGNLSSPNYVFSFVPGTLSIVRASQALSFAAPASATYGDAPIDLASSATGGGAPTPITFAVTSGPGALAGSVLTFTGAGSIVVTASQAGDSNWLAAADVPGSIAVAQARSQALLSSSPSPSIFGESVTFTAVVSMAQQSPIGTATGTVTFLEGSAVLGTGLLSGGVATFQTAALSAGSHAVTASYGGDVNFLSGVSASSAQVVAQAPSAIALAASPATSTFADAVTLSASVSVPAPGAGHPTGAVTFYDGGIALGTATLGASGLTSMSLATLAAGSHSLTASYSGDGSFLGSTSGKTLFPVSGAAPTVAFTSAPAGTVFGQPLALSVAVSGPGGVPSGGVAFSDGGTALGTVLLDASGAGTLTVSSLAVGSHALTAAYGGAGNYLPASKGHSVVVGQASVAGTLATLSSPSVGSESVTFHSSFTAVAPGAGALSGTVTFRDGATILGTVPLAAGAAALRTSAVAVGAHSIVAAYSGDASFLPASASVGQRVDLATPLVTAVLSPPAPSYGQHVTVGATVAPQAPATAIPTGSVSFRDGSTVLGAVALDGAGKASFTLAAPLAGAHTLLVVYAGDAVFTPAGATASALAVGTASTTIAVVAAPAAAVSGQPVSFAVTVTSAGGTPTGAVALADGAVSLGAATLSAGAATLALPGGLHAGTHSLTASYAGDGNFAAAPPAALAFAVSRATSALALDASANPPRVNRPVTFVAHVSAVAPGAGVPQGEVAFRDGATLLGTVRLDASGAATLPVASLPFGTHAVSGAYAGSTEFLTSGAMLSGGLVIEKSPPVAGSGTAVTFDGQSQAAFVANGNGALDSARTVELWFSRAAGDAASAAPACLVQSGSGDAVRYGLCLSPARDGLEVRRGAERHPVAVALAAGWHHLALVDQGSSTVLFLDEAQVATLAGGFGAGTAQPLVLAAAQSGAARAEWFAGSLDEVRLWSAALPAASLAASARSPVASDDTDLLALWRMDEGEGSALYDAASGHVVARLEGASAPAWAASDAWKRRTTQQERALEPFVAGYDPDGAPITVSISAAAANGTAAVSTGRTPGGSAFAAGLVEYAPASRFVGGDAFTCSVSNGSSSATFTTEVQVVRIDACQLQSDCAGGDVCVNEVCEAPAVLNSVSGGCSVLPLDANPALLPLAVMVALGLLRRRRKVAAAATAGKWRRAGFAALLVLCAAAQARATGFALDTYRPAPVGDRFFAVPDADVLGNLTPTFGLQAGWAHQPLVINSKGVGIPNGQVVQDQMALRLGGAVPLFDRVLLDADISMSAWQQGQTPFSGQTAISASAFADPRIGARVALVRGERLSVAAGLSVFLPLGSQDNYGSDASLRAAPEVLASGRRGALVYASQLALDLRRHSDILFTQTGSGLRLAAAGGWLFLGERLQVGPELYSRLQFSQASSTSSLEALLGARLQQGAFTFGAAVGGRLVQDAPGAAPLRVIGSVTFNGFDLLRSSSRSMTSSQRPSQFGGDTARSAPTAEPAPEAAPEPVAAPVAAPAPEAPPAPIAVAFAAPPPAAPPPAALPAAAPLVEVKSGEIALHGAVNFEHDRAVLLHDADPLLEAAAVVLRAQAELGSVVIAGYADNHGSRSHNLKLTAARAEAVRAWFIAHGIAPERLQALGCGGARPIADNATDAGRSKNRRVELLLPTPDGKLPGCDR